MRRSVAKLLILLDIIVMLVASIVCKITGSGALFLIILACLVVWAVLAQFLRCPNCGRLPRRGGLFDEYCSHCGECLDFE